MKSLRNSVQLIGRLGQDPEVIELKSGKKLAKFSLATNESYRDAKGEKVMETQWHNIVAWERKATFANDYLKKGMEIALEGKLIHRDYETSNGDKRIATEINMNDVVMVGGKA
ncbi:MAG: single-stranded DNA-binding protein [Bacteroidetes bacterium]|nr:single-stranded DNA-binding protein [Bacteroidota bacterium]MDA1121404.1 single-stranded DNA-binding protein [Bacteroidota bacterium]